jgi:hypothetical protein
MCNLKSFSFVSTLSQTVPVGLSLDMWGVSPSISWAYQQKQSGSTVNIQGFKNINIHSIKAVGDVFTSLLNTGYSMVVEDWIFYVGINGQSPLVGANVTASPNTMNVAIQGNNPIYSLSKYRTSLDFTDPITSVQSIQLLDVRASGLSAQALTNINLGWYVNFLVYYTFQDEEY